MPVYVENIKPSESYKAPVERGNLQIKFNIKFPQELD